MQVKRGILLVFVAAMSPLAVWAQFQTSPNEVSQSGGRVVATEFNDPIARLQRAIDEGLVGLEFDDTHGYLIALLEALEIPVSSQVLPFAKSSFQIFQVSPENPRAIYFNDNVYVGRVQGIPILEIAAVDPVTGPVFYTLEEDRDLPPRFRLRDTDCIICHDSSRIPGIAVPRLLLLSVLPDAKGNAIGRAALSTTDQSSFGERWGGWYVTGSHGEQLHLGNLTVTETSVRLDPLNNTIDIRAEIDLLEPAQRANLTDVSDQFDTSRYLSPHSDMVALMVLGHQTHVLNLIARANYEAGTAIREEQEAGQQYSDATIRLVDESAEALVHAMLFVGEELLEGPIVGTSDFAREFASQGTGDSQGRSLRDLDLETRLLRYPLSYLIYSEAFDGLTELVREQVYERFLEVLEGEDTSEEFAHLSRKDRDAILEILEETKSDFRP